MSTPVRSLTNYKVAVIHDWLDVVGGAERTLKDILEVFPQADLFSLVDFMREEDRGFLKGRQVTTSFIQRLPFARKKFRNYLPLFPFAIEQLDVSGYEVVVSSSFAVAKGVRTSPSQVHISYCYSPMRYIWDQERIYLSELGLDRGIASWIVRYCLHHLRLWDTTSSNSVDQFVAISSFVQSRIEKFYRRSSRVIFPPVSVEDFTFCGDKEDFYLTASRLVPYKKPHLIVEAFREMPDRRLVVIGDGPEAKRVAKAAAGAANITVLGYQDFATLRSYMQRAKGFIFAGEEDFGIAPVEAQACGTPVIGLGRGGLTDTVRVSGPDPTGLFFHQSTKEAIIDAVGRFEASEARYRPDACRANAERFSSRRFRREFAQFCQAVIDQHYGTSPNLEEYEYQLAQGQGAFDGRKGYVSNLAQAAQA